MLPAILLAAALGLPAGAGCAQAAGEPGAADHPRVYALIAAVGARFNAVQEVQRTGSHLPPYRRRSAEASGNFLNRLVLASLDQEVARADPRGQRIHLALDPSRVDAKEPALREAAALEAVLSALQSIEGRSAWHRILVVTPAYRALERDGLASRLHGLGLFVNPLCESDVRSCELGLRPPSGPKAMTPEGEVTAANNFVAPFSYIAVWVIDPATLAVLERREVLEHQKLHDPMSSSPDISVRVPRRFLAERILDVTSRSVANAFRLTDLAGRVEVGEVREVDPGKAKPAGPR